MNDFSLLIKGKKKPENCDECFEKYNGFGWVEHNEEWGTFYCKEANGFCSDPRTKCPLIEIPNKHGDLIDAKELDYAFTMLRFNPDGSLKHWDDRKNWCMHGSEVERLIENAPVVIPAEE